nr:pseudouridine synthase [Corynebacterium lactis]
MLRQPLPIRDGLNPSRIAAPGRRGDAPTRAWDLLFGAVTGQNRRHPDDDEAAIARRFDDGLVVRANGSPYAPEDLLKPGAEMWFYRTPAPEATIAGPMPIVHADDNLVVVDKPSFLATMPRGRHITETAVVRLRRELGNPDLVPAHRLDRMTSGLLIFTARREVRGAYQGLFASGQVTKRYHALTRTRPLGVDRLEGLGPHSSAIYRGQLPAAPLEVRTRQRKIAGELQAHTLGPGEGEPNAHTVVESVSLADVPSDADGVAATCGEVALWQLRPVTGRTHQLRLHLCELGFPILGDQVYPEVLPEEAENVAEPLHLLCAEMSFVDPITGKERTFRSRRSVFNPLFLGVH